MRGFRSEMVIDEPTRVEHRARRPEVELTAAALAMYQLPSSPDLLADRLPRGTAYPRKRGPSAQRSSWCSVQSPRTSRTA